jgi:hypothetical protein
MDNNGFFIPQSLNFAVLSSLHLPFMNKDRTVPISIAGRCRRTHLRYAGVLMKAMPIALLFLTTRVPAKKGRHPAD